MTTAQRASRGLAADFAVQTVGHSERHRAGEHDASNAVRTLLSVAGRLARTIGTGNFCFPSGNYTSRSPTS